MPYVHPDDYADTFHNATAGQEREADLDPRAVLEALRRWLKHELAHNLEYRSTARDPKANGFAFVAVPEWALRQRLGAIEAALDADTGGAS